MAEIRIAQFFKLTTNPSRTQGAKTYFYQNYFVNETKDYNDDPYAFAPFQVDGALASLNGDNQQLRVLFGSQEVAIRLVEQGDGNRLSVLQLTTIWTDATGNLNGAQLPEFFIGTGATFSESTLELRFRSSMDSVGARFPARSFTNENVGILPLNAELYLR